MHKKRTINAQYWTSVTESGDMLEEGTIVRKLFFGQVTFSISLEFFGKWLPEVVNNRIVYDDFSLKRVFVSLFKEDPEYHLVRKRLQEMNVEIVERGELEWASFEEPMEADKRIPKVMKRRTFYEINGSKLYPGAVCKNGKAYFLLHYIEGAKDEVMDRLNGFVRTFSDLVGPESFSIEEIGTPRGYLSFLKSMEIPVKLVEAELETNFEGNYNFLVKNFSSAAENIKVIANKGSVSNEYPLFSLHSQRYKFVPSMTDSFKMALGSFYFPLTVFGICRDGHCKVKVIYEKNRGPGLLRVLMMMKGKNDESVVKGIRNIDIG